MKSFYIKQKFLSVTDSLDVYDEHKNSMYTIKGDFAVLQKSYVVTDLNSQESAYIKRNKTFLPSFTVEVEKGYNFLVKKHFSIFNTRYSIEGEGVVVHGDWIDLEFTIEHNGQEIATVSQQVIALDNTYEITVFDEAWEMIVITLVVAIDRVKEERFTLSSLFDFWP